MSNRKPTNRHLALIVLSRRPNRPLDGPNRPTMVVPKVLFFRSDRPSQVFQVTPVVQPSCPFWSSWSSGYLVPPQAPSDPEFIGIEVERRVAPTPPHRFRRAVFPHRALQNHSLPHLQRERRNSFHLRRPFLNYPWFWNLIPDQRLFEGNPVVASTLAPPIEPFIENPYGYVVELA